MEKTGLTTVTFRNFDIETVCKTAADNGIKFIEWGGDVHLPPGDGVAAKRAAELRTKFGLESLSYGSYYKLGMNDMKLWAAIIDSAKAVNAPIIRIWAGTSSSRETTEKEFLEMVRETKVIANEAKKHGLTLAFEFHKNTYNDSAESCKKLLEAVAEENVKTYWQPFAFDNDEETLQKILPFVISVHVFQWDKEYNRYPLSEGEEQWKRFVDIIREKKRDMNFVMEFVKDDSPEQFSRDVLTLKEHILR